MTGTWMTVTFEGNPRKSRRPCTLRGISRTALSRLFSAECIVAFCFSRTAFLRLFCRELHCRVLFFANCIVVFCFSRTALSRFVFAKRNWGSTRKASARFLPLGDYHRFALRDFSINFRLSRVKPRGSTGLGLHMNNKTETQRDEDFRELRCRILLFRELRCRVFFFANYVTNQTTTAATNNRPRQRTSACSQMRSTQSFPPTIFPPQIFPITKCSQNKNFPTRLSPAPQPPASFAWVSTISADLGDPEVFKQHYPNTVFHLVCDRFCACGVAAPKHQQLFAKSNPYAAPFRTNSSSWRR